MPGASRRSSASNDGRITAVTASGAPTTKRRNDLRANLALRLLFERRGKARDGLTIPQHRHFLDGVHSLFRTNAIQRRILKKQQRGGQNKLHHVNKSFSTPWSGALLDIPCPKVAIAGIQNILWKVSFFNLDGCVIDVKPFPCDTVDPRQQFRPIGIAVCNNMAAHCKNA